MSPQLWRLVSLNPSVFAGAIIARSAISPPPPATRGGAGGREGEGQRAAGASELGTAMNTAAGAGDGGGSGDDDGAGGRVVGPDTERVGEGVTVTSSVQTTTAPPQQQHQQHQGNSSGAGDSRLDGTGRGPAGNRPSSAHVVDRGGGNNRGRGGGVGLSADADAVQNSWRVVAGETLAAAMPDVARGEMRGAPSCCAVADVGDGGGGDASCSLPDVALDEACSPLPLMARALRDIVGALDAARMVRNSFGWIVRGEGEMAETAASTMEERERRLDQLGSLMWTLGEFRRSLLLYEGGTARARAALGKDGPGSATTTTVTAAGGKTAGAGDTSAALVVGRDGGCGGGGGVAASYMRLVIEEIQRHLIRTLEAAALVTLPACPYRSFRMDSDFVCEHAGWRHDEEAEGEGDHGGCVTCTEVVRPFLDNPHECWTTWVPWAGVDGEGGEEFAPALYQRLGLQCSVVGDAVKVKEKGGCSALLSLLRHFFRPGGGM